MTTLQIMWRLVRFTPRLYLGSLLLQIARLGILVVPGLRAVRMRTTVP